MSDFPEFSLLITHDCRLFDQVYGRLRSAIVTGYFEPGTRLVERDLTEKLQVSRTPIREALRRLEQDGLIVCYPHRGYYVRTPSLDEARQAYEVRRALEGLACELAAQRASAEELAAMRDIVRKGKAALKAADHANLLLLNNELHLALVRSTHNTYLEQQFRTIWSCVDLLRGRWWGTERAARHRSCRARGDCGRAREARRRAGTTAQRSAHRPGLAEHRRAIQPGRGTREGARASGAPLAGSGLACQRLARPDPNSQRMGKIAKMKALQSEWDTMRAARSRRTRYCAPQ